MKKVAGADKGAEVPVIEPNKSGEPVPGYVYGQHWVYFHPMKGSGRNK